MLEIRGLKKRFGSRQAVDGLSLSATAGEVVGVLGPNGAGKSTTMRIAAGVLEPDEGDVSIDGRSIITERLEAQRRLGYLPEGAPLYDHMSPREFLDFIAAARGIARSERAAAVDRATADARLTVVRRQRISGLSKGYRRRVGLAAAILHDPPVLILDEPTDGLDPNQKRAVRALIARMAETKAILISTHTLEEAPAMCTRVVVVDQGRIVADDTPAGLAARDPGGLAGAFQALTDQAEAAAA